MIVLYIICCVVIPVFVLLLNGYRDIDPQVLFEELKALEDRARKVTFLGAATAVLAVLSAVALAYWLPVLFSGVVISTVPAPVQSVKSSSVEPDGGLPKAIPPQEPNEQEIKRIADKEFESRTKHIVQALQNRDSTAFRTLDREDKRRILEQEFFTVHLLHGRPGNTRNQNQSVTDYHSYLKGLADSEGFSGRGISTGELEKLKTMRRNSPFGSF